MHHLQLRRIGHILKSSMPKQQFQALFFIIRWWYASLLLFDRSKLDPTTKGLNNWMEDQMSLFDGLSSQNH